MDPGVQAFPFGPPWKNFARLKPKESSRGSGPQLAAATSMALLRLDSLGGAIRAPAIGNRSPLKPSLQI